MFLAITPRLTIIMLAGLATLRFMRAFSSGLIIFAVGRFCGHWLIIFAGFRIIIIALPVIARPTDFVLTRPHFGDNAKIMFGKLEVIFGYHPITLHLRITRQGLVFFEHLRRISTRPIVNTVALFLIASTISGGTLAGPPPATTGLTIVKQRHFPHAWGCCVVPFISAAASPVHVTRP